MTILHKRIAVIIFCLFIVILRCFPDENKSPWYEGFFIEGSLHYYFAPDSLAELVDTQPGFRAAFGYEFRHFRFAVESGYTRITGTNPLVLNTTLIPLAFKTGYVLPIHFGLAMQADLMTGFFYSHTSHYDTALDMIMGQVREDSERSFFAGGRLYATWTVPGNFLKLYAGGGADLVLEPDGPIPLPLAEAGISFKPAALVRLIARTVKTGRQNTRIEKMKSISVFSAVYFETGSTSLSEQGRATLDAAGKYLAMNPRAILVLRSYAVHPDIQNRRELSLNRGKQCRDYLVNTCRIDAERIIFETWGAESAPDTGDKNRKLYYSVELIVNR